jgi:hypothetical protein
MIADIFIRTYARDIESLNYCLQSIDKFASGFRKIIITIPARDRHLLGHNPKYEIHTVKHYNNDYLGQQATKLLADQYSDADLILFIDSDCLVVKNITPESFLKDGKPFILKTKYSEMEGDVLAWREITAKALGFIPEYEYMRRLPLMYWREHLSQLRNAMQVKHKKSLEDYITSQPANSFSEFNALGAFCEYFYSDKYYFQDTEDGIPTELVWQYWSHDMRTDNRENIIKKIKSVIHAKN